jgi:hypothetical protein
METFRPDDEECLDAPGLLIGWPSSLQVTKWTASTNPSYGGQRPLTSDLIREKEQT